MRFTLALVCVALAFAAASAAEDIDVNGLHAKLAAVDPSLAALSGKASTSNVDNDNYYTDDYYKYEKKYDDKYQVYDEYKKTDDKYKKYDDKYEKYDDKYEKKYEEPKYDDKYTKYDDKYAKDTKDSKYEADNKYYDTKSHEGYYGGQKLTIKVWEKSRGPKRFAGAGNGEYPTTGSTYQFSSIVTCENPKTVKDLHSTDGVIDMPVDPKLKITPVGVCEWTVTDVHPQKVGKHAEIKGATNVVCTFTEEAERTCKGDFLCDKMSISAQGLMYHFEQEPADYSYGKKEATYGAEADINVALSIINGVNGGHKKNYDNGVIQYYVGAESPKYEYDAAAQADKKEPAYAAPSDNAGSYTFVLQGASHY